MVNKKDIKKHISDFNGLLSYIEENKNNLIKMTGDCSNCHIKYRCIGEKRRIGINEIRALEPKKSRFPFIKRLVDAFPFILHLVPQFIYDKWGKMETNLGCHYNAADIVLSTDRIERVYNLLGDAISKKIYIYLLMYRMTLNPVYIYDAYTDEKQYFIEPYKGLGRNEIVVDCGGFIGDTLEEYLSFNTTPSLYYLYEPDDENIIAIRQRISKLGLKEVACIRHSGVFSKTGKLWFNPGKGSCCHVSNIEQPGSIVIDAVSLDDDIDTPVTLVKMDIEGSERYALAGAVRIIESYSPKLAICVYHSVSDLWEIPFMIAEKFTSYNNYAIRHHSYGTFLETVFYSWRT